MLLPQLRRAAKAAATSAHCYSGAGGAAGSRRTMATKKAGGSTTNGRDSIGRRLGVKLLHDQPAKAGSILVRQRGLKFKPGRNVGVGKDHTLFAEIAGIVKMEKVMKLPVGNGAKHSNRKRAVRNVVHIEA